MEGKEVFVFRRRCETQKLPSTRVNCPRESNMIALILYWRYSLAASRAVKQILTRAPLSGNKRPATTRPPCPWLKTRVPGPQRARRPPSLLCVAPIAVWEAQTKRLHMGAQTKQLHTQTKQLHPGMKPLHFAGSISLAPYEKPCCRVHRPRTRLRSPLRFVLRSLGVGIASISVVKKKTH